MFAPLVIYKDITDYRPIKPKREHRTEITLCELSAARHHSDVAPKGEIISSASSRTAYPSGTNMIIRLSASYPP